MHLVGATGFKMQARQRAEHVARGGCEVGFVLEPDVAAAFQFGPAPAFDASHFVDAVADELHGMELVEGDLGLERGRFV